MTQNTLPCIGHGTITVQINDQAMLPTIMQCCGHACLTRRRRQGPCYMHSCLHDGMWALHELAWHAGTFVASHNLATAWHRVCNDVMGLGRHAKAILCMGGIHVSAVLPACMPPPIMGASKASNRLRSKFLRGWTSEGSVQATPIGGRLPEKLLRCNSLVKCCMTRFAVYLKIHSA